MSAESAQISAKEAARIFGKLVDSHGVQTLVALPSLSDRIVNNQNAKSAKGSPISGSALTLVYGLIEKAEAFGLEIDDQRLLQRSSALLKGYREEIAEELRDHLGERIAALEEREAELSRREEAVEKGRAGLQEWETSLEEVQLGGIERRSSLYQREREVDARAAEVRKREEEVAAQIAEVKWREERTSEGEIIWRALGMYGGLAPEPRKSLALARAEFEEQYHGRPGAWVDRKRAKSRRINLEQRERTFNIITAPLRILTYAIARRGTTS